jgi:SWI/SNF-related matrix-associated actin-dependent regulator of chromatin subfamily B protein 1
MPSPAAHTSSNNSPQADADSEDRSPDEEEAQAGDDKRNGIQHNGKAPAPQPRASIQEGKQKAKAVMASSGLTPAKLSPRDAKAVQEADVRSKGKGVNGTAPSRKRSRSGTRILHPSSAENPSPEIVKEFRNEVLLERYVNRQQLNDAAIFASTSKSNDLTASKRAEANYYLALREQRRPNGRLHDPAGVYGAGYDGRYANPATNIRSRGSQVLFPSQRRRAGGRKSRELRVPKKELATQSEQFDELVPIRLDIEWDKVRLRDTFTWNLHDRVVPPDLFAEQLVEDFQLPMEQCQQLVQQVSTSIRDQIQDFYPPMFIEEEALDPHLPYSAYKDDGLRIIIRLNITIGQHTLIDQFEWEINNPQNSPEQFAEQMTHDLSLSGEFTTAIAHSIREQSQLFIRSLWVTGYAFDGRPVEDHELKAGFQPSPLPSSFRPYQAAKEFAPYIYMLSEQELEKTELSLSREERRQKRSVTRRGGPAMPDLKDRRRTIRTMVVSSVLPDAAETIEESRLFKRAPVSSGRSRRPGFGQRDDLDDSEESESEESAPSSPAIPPHLLSGTARTRNMRGAATVAQQAMRSTLGRSATPETSSLHHHETRTSGRRRDYREESVDDSPPTLIIKLRIGRERYRRWWRENKPRPTAEPLQNLTPTPGPHRRSQSVTSNQGTPAPRTMGPPPTTPGLPPNRSPRPSNASTPQREGQPPPSLNQIHPHAAQIGRVDAKGPPGHDNPIVRNPFLLSYLMK